MTQNSASNSDELFTNPIWEAIGRCPVIYVQYNRRRELLDATLPRRTDEEYLENWKSDKITSV